MAYDIVIVASHQYHHTPLLGVVAGLHSPRFGGRNDHMMRTVIRLFPGRQAENHAVHLSVLVPTSDLLGVHAEIESNSVISLSRGTRIAFVL